MPTPSGPASRMACGGAPATIAPTASRAAGWPRVYARFTSRADGRSSSGRIAGRGRRRGLLGRAPAGRRGLGCGLLPVRAVAALVVLRRGFGASSVRRLRGGLRPARPWPAPEPRPRRQPRSFPAPRSRPPSTCGCFASPEWLPQRCLLRRGRSGLACRASPRGRGRLGRHRSLCPVEDCLGRDRFRLAGRRSLLAELRPQQLLELGRNLAPLGRVGARSPGRRSVVASATRLATRRGA